LKSQLSVGRGEVSSVDHFQTVTLDVTVSQCERERGEFDSDEELERFAFV
jgi:hypothetical protein